MRDTAIMTLADVSMLNEPPPDQLWDAAPGPRKAFSLKSIILFGFIKNGDGLFWAQKASGVRRSHPSLCPMMEPNGLAAATGSAWEPKSATTRRCCAVCRAAMSARSPCCTTGTPGG
jgi:hypothetical protein